MASPHEEIGVPTTGFRRRSALYPGLEHLVVHCPGVGLEIIGLKTGETIAECEASLYSSAGRSLAIGGTYVRPMLAWIDAEGCPCLWSYQDPGGLAGAPTSLEGLERYLPGLEGEHYDKVWLSGGNTRAWIVFSMHPSGAFVSNGRVSTFLDPGCRVVGVGTSRCDSALALVLESGEIIIIKDAETEVSVTDAMGPSLLTQSVVACPVSALNPLRCRLPIGMTLGEKRRHVNPFTPVARVVFSGDEAIWVTWVGPSKEPESRRLCRRLLRIDIEGASAHVQVDFDVPSGVAYEVQVVCDYLPHPVPDPVWISPTIEGAKVHRPGETTPLSHLSVKELSNIDVQGAPGQLKSLWARGLRWDGVDPVDGLSQREWGELRGGEWVVVDGKTVALHVIDGQADRVFLCAKAGGVPKVLGHPISKLGSEEMRRRAVDRPGVDLMAASLNNDEQYLALWRRPKGVELWSVRAGDRLCAWPLSGAGGWPRRIVHGEEDPAFLPTLFALEGVGPQEDPWVQIRVYRLEFGVTEAESIGCLEVPWNHGGEEIEPIGFEGTSWRVGGREVRVGGRGCDD